MQQIFTTLVTWRQLEQYLFPRLRTIWKSTPFRKAAPLDPDRNVFLHKVGFLSFTAGEVRGALRQ